MQNVVLIILLLLAAALIAVVLLQRSEGGGLGMGGGGGGGVQARGSGNALTRLTWILGAGFMVAALALTIISARVGGNSSVLDGTGGSLLPPSASESAPSGDELLPPSLGEDEPLLPVAE